ncbi:MAG: MFS transporter [Anaerolineales bacterium]
MSQSPNRPITQSPNFHYAWVVALVTGLVLLATAGVRTAPQILIKPLEAEFGWSRASISLAVAVSILWFGLGAPLSGTLVRRFGLRTIMTVGLFVIAAGLGLMLLIDSLWQLHLFWGLIAGIGTGMLANVLGAIVANRWFVKHRGLIVGLMGAASAAGQLIFINAMVALNNWNGWRTALQVMALVMGVLVVPVWLFIREWPRDVGQRPLGEDADAGAAASAAADDDQHTSLSDAIRTRDFWLLAASFFVCGYTTNGLIGTHLLPHSIEHGFTSEVAGSAIAIMGIFNILGTLASGWLSDRYDNRVLLACYYGFRALSLLFLPLVANYSSLLIFSIVYGLDWIATVPPTINLTAQRFGRASVGVLYGWIFFSHMVGAAVAAYLGGVLRDSLGDYTLAFLSAAVLGFVAAGFSMGIRRLRLTQSPTALTQRR